LQVFLVSVVIIEQLRDANAIGLMKLSEKFLDKQSVGVSTVRIYWLFVFFSVLVPSL